jgi:hypothetical protein
MTLAKPRWSSDENAIALAAMRIIATLEGNESLVQAKHSANLGFKRQR